MLAQSVFEDRVIEIKRVSKKNKGGGKIRFTALVVVGDRHGAVGVGLGKAPDVNSAIRKGTSLARKNVVPINLRGTTIPHRIYQTYKAANVMLKPAPEGSGLIAGGPIRSVAELAGIKNISAKMFGSNNKSCVVYCTVRALQKLKAGR
ncbi:30S ribosomal protein S5 [candidate division WWE3 bacterium]|nr:30S ribosomal protein S5 [candidate division WWE3 bacterium]